MLLNSVSLISVYTFDLVLQPLVRDKQQWLHRNVGWFYKVLWLMPVVGASLYLNVSKHHHQTIFVVSQIHSTHRAPGALSSRSAHSR